MTITARCETCFNLMPYCTCLRDSIDAALADVVEEPELLTLSDAAGHDPHDPAFGKIGEVFGLLHIYEPCANHAGQDYHVRVYPMKVTFDETGGMLCEGWPT